MSTDKILVKERMLDRVAKSQAHFKSQQQNESDLTVLEKRQFAENLLERSVVLFLQRFHKYLILEDLQFFGDQKDVYEVNFYLEECRKENDMNKRKLKVKNRRYAAMQRLITQGEYFNDVHMRERMPHLYEQMIGQYQTSEEKRAAFPENPNATFSEFLMTTIDKNYEEKRKEEQEDAERAAEEESDSDENSQEELESEEEELNNSDASRQTANVSVEERERYRHEFTTIMFEHFLSGKDSYDYKSIDDNTELDCNEMCDVDEEEKYFDSEDPS